MACSHCFINSTPKKSHMPFPTFIQAVQFAKRVGVSVLIISGGEPTDHPQFAEFMHYLTFNYDGAVTVCSHGDFIEDRDKCRKYFDQLPSLFWQITNDERYYPKALNRERAAEIERQYERIGFVWKIGGELYPQGRARRHMGITEETSKCVGTRCFNLRSLTCNPQVGTFQKAVAMLESRLRFCTPSINIDGTIGMGESTECPETARVTDTLEQVTKAIQTSQCNDCGMLNDLPKTHTDAINYHPA